MRRLLWIFICLAVVIVLFEIYSKSIQENKTVPLPQGKQIYSILGGKVDPKIIQVAFDPFDPSIGESQEVVVILERVVPVTSARVTMKTDNKQLVHVLTEVTSTAENSTWRGVWKTEDTHNIRYNVLIEAEGENNTSVELTLR